MASFSSFVNAMFGHLLSETTFLTQSHFSSSGSSSPSSSQSFHSSSCPPALVSLSLYEILGLSAPMTTGAASDLFTGAVPSS
ncbi:hypothetical protein SLA2020_087070 [Shorea laevis]